MGVIEILPPCGRLNDTFVLTSILFPNLVDSNECVKTQTLIIMRHGLHGFHGTHPLVNETSGHLDDTEIFHKSESSVPKIKEDAHDAHPLSLYYYFSTISLALSKAALMFGQIFSLPIKS